MEISNLEVNSIDFSDDCRAMDHVVIKNIIFVFRLWESIAGWNREIPLMLKGSEHGSHETIHRAASRRLESTRRILWNNGWDAIIRNWWHIAHAYCSKASVVFFYGKCNLHLLNEVRGICYL